MATKWEHEMGCVCGMREAEEKCLQLLGWKESYGKKELGRPGVEGRIILKVKVIPLQAWASHEVSRSLRLPDFKTIGT